MSLLGLTVRSLYLFTYIPYAWGLWGLRVHSQTLTSRVCRFWTMMHHPSRGVWCPFWWNKCPSWTHLCHYLIKFVSGFLSCWEEEWPRQVWGTGWMLSPGGFAFENRWGERPHVPVGHMIQNSVGMSPRKLLTGYQGGDVSVLKFHQRVVCAGWKTCNIVVEWLINWTNSYTALYYMADVILNPLQKVNLFDLVRFFYHYHFKDKETQTQRNE